MRSAILVAFIGLSLAFSASAQPAPGSPEEAIRELLRSVYANDAAAYERWTLPHPRRHLLVGGGSANEEALQDLEADPEALQIIMQRPFEYRGRPAEPDERGGYPPGTTALFVAAHGSGPVVVRLAKQAEGWRVDLRWWLAMMELGSGEAFEPGTPDYAARALTASLLQLDREGAATFAVPGAAMDVLFAGAPSQPEPSGHLDALVLEMPIVEIGPGEFAAFPSGRVVEGAAGEDVKVLVGLFGSVELPFVVRRVGAEWRVEAEPYFYLLMQ